MARRCRLEIQIQIDISYDALWETDLVNWLPIMGIGSAMTKTPNVAHTGHGK